MIPSIEDNLRSSTQSGGLARIGPLSHQLFHLVLDWQKVGLQLKAVDSSVHFLSNQNVLTELFSCNSILLFKFLLFLRSKVQPLLRLEIYDVERIKTKFLNLNPAKCTHNVSLTSQSLLKTPDICLSFSIYYFIASSRSWHLQGPVIVLVIWPLIIHISLIRTGANVQ